MSALQLPESSVDSANAVSGSWWVMVKILVKWPAMMPDFLFGLQATAPKWIHFLLPGTEDRSA